MLANLLREAHLHTGCDLDPNGESLLFLQWNEWLLKQAGCRWDNRTNWKTWIKPLHDKTAQQLRLILETNHARKAYWGKRIWPPCFDAKTPPWGWKDPRNTFTFPTWHKVFPHARMIIITRHGVDVAQSLTTRAHNELHNWRATRNPPPDRLITGSARCLTLEGAFDIWEEYQTSIQELRKSYPTETLLIQYEDLVANSDAFMTEVYAFCNLTPPINPKIQQSMHTHRIHAYRHSPELIAFAKTHSHRLQPFGYEP